MELKKAFEEILKLNSFIREGKENGTITYQNYSKTVKPKIENFKENYSYTPNMLLKNIIAPYFEKIDEALKYKRGLKEGFSLKDYSHYGNNTLYEYTWACLYYRKSNIDSLFASYSPQLYILIHSHGIKFGFCYGAHINKDSKMIKNIINNDILLNDILNLKEEYNFYTLEKGSAKLASDDDLIIINSSEDINKNWDDKIHIINQYSNKNIPDNIEEVIKRKLDLIYPLFKDISALEIQNRNISFEKPSIFSSINFQRKCSDANLLIKNTVNTRFITSLLTKPFVIFTGLSGSGKTKLAEAFAMWISENEEQYCLVPVGADWTNREPLLGFPNALETGKYISPENGVLKLLIDASNNQDKPYFLILDEMNMSHVERYFADFLSAMESIDRKISLHSGNDDWISNDLKIPPSVNLPKNLYIIGTVNIDETTYMFSPKVLDRANVIEFRVEKDDMESFLTEPKALDFDNLKFKGSLMSSDFVKKALEQKQSDPVLKTVLLDFFEMLQKTGAEFGYRTAAEISRFYSYYNELSETEDKTERQNEIVDAAIMQKLLPKLHGSRSRIEKILVELGSLCLVDTNDKDPFTEDKKGIKYTLSHNKLKRMHQRVISDGFTSYAEA